MPGPGSKLLNSAAHIRRLHYTFSGRQQLLNAGSARPANLHRLRFPSRIRLRKCPMDPHSQILHRLHNLHKHRFQTRQQIPLHKIPRPNPHNLHRVPRRLVHGLPLALHNHNRRKHHAVLNNLDRIRLQARPLRNAELRIGDLLLEYQCDVLALVEVDQY